MKWYVYYKENNHGKCKCFDEDGNGAKIFAATVHGKAYMGF